MREWTTYRMADGSQIYGEYAFVDGPEFFEGVDQPTDVVEETWVLKSSRTVTFKPTHWDDEAVCDDCGLVDDHQPTCAQFDGGESGLNSGQNPSRGA